jgi:hypothetical protein
MQHSTDDNFAKLAKKARGYQHSRCYNSSTQEKYKKTPDFLPYIYTKWSIDCGHKRRYFKEQDDFDGFKNWIENTKFTADRLAELSQIYSNKK